MQKGICIVLLCWQLLAAAAVEPIVIDIPSGASMREIAQSLKQAGIIDSAWWFELRARMAGYQFKAGEYAFEPHSSSLSVLKQLEQGVGLQHTMTIVEGMTFSDLVKALQHNPNLKHTMDSMTQLEIMSKLDKPGEHPEGWFMPETYHFPKDTTDIAVLSRAIDSMSEQLEQMWHARNPNVPLLNSYQALILASIVEKETAVRAEYGKIAGVFYNRLAKGMRLQTDPTVIYGLGDEFDGNLTRAHLRQKTAYNTYVIDGLPPTPIAMPSVAAIEAVLNPEPTQALYFVANASGGHQFSETLKAHNEAVDKYIRQK